MTIREEIENALLEIQLALDCSHNTITTDLVEAKPDDTHWRIDHKKAFDSIDKIRELILDLPDER